MNSLLSVKLTFDAQKNTQTPGPKNLNKSKKTSSDHIRKLIDDLRNVLRFYNETEVPIKDVLVDVKYNVVVPKTGRIERVLKGHFQDCNDSIVGARFSDEETHIITHYVDRDCIQTTIYEMEETARFVDSFLGGEANSENFDSKRNIDYDSFRPKWKTKIRAIVIDCSVVESFSVPNIAQHGVKASEATIVTFYKTEKAVSDLLQELNVESYYSVARNTISVSKETLDYLTKKIPYLISMTATDISEISPNSVEGNFVCTKEIPNPKNEPTIGVIDTLFAKDVYFNRWVDYRETLDEFERYTPSSPSDCFHGTSVDSIIVDGPALNPWLEDGCGRFRIRHFGVCKNKISPSRLIKKIEDIIATNLDIKVWNLSLGTVEETSKNFISFDAAALDAIQQKYDVIFVVSGTNDNNQGANGEMRLGSPADSLNSIVVNSVNREKKPASYARRGPVLSFFNKPDVAYFGGDVDDRMIVCSHRGEEGTYGTSFAAPWITRKVAYLINVLGFTREIAKALIVDSAAKWDFEKSGDNRLIGYGVVPIKIEEIVNSDDSEIRFVVSGVTKAYTTFNYSIPVPKDEDNKTSYVARATLCYFPECDRLQGVDYTQRELSIKFGRFKEKIIDIKGNNQDDDGGFADEKNARTKFRKWENTKFISEKLTDRTRRKDLFGEGFYGLSITTKERKRVASMSPLKFGVVITLRHIRNLNRIDEFKHLCILRGYIVDTVQIKQKENIYNFAQEDINFD